MSEQSDQDYFTMRAATERQLSASASDPAAALAHAKLAERYERLAGGQIAPRPTLHVITG